MSNIPPSPSPLDLWAADAAERAARAFIVAFVGVYTALPDATHSPTLHQALAAGAAAVGSLVLSWLARHTGDTTSASFVASYGTTPPPSPPQPAPAPRAPDPPEHSAP